MRSKLLKLKPPTASAVEGEEQRIRTEKLRTELALLQHQLSPAARRGENLKLFASISGTLTAIIALVGLGLSGYQWFQAQKLERAVRTEERLDRALQQSSGTTPPARLAGVVSLGSFLHDSDSAQDAQVLLALTNMLAVEESLTVRNAIVATISGVDQKVTGEIILNKSLVAAAQVSRDLVDEGDLWRARRTLPHTIPEPSSVEARAISVATAITSLIRKGAHTSDLSRTYFAGSDLSGCDLRAVVFDGAILAWANLRSAKLIRASFLDADLEGSSFVGADLRAASLEQSLKQQPGTFRQNYIDDQLKRNRGMRNGFLFHVTGPDFRCSDLRNASFHGHPLLPVYLDRMSYLIAVDGFLFTGANLTGTRFSGLKAFGALPLNDEEYSGPYPAQSGWGYWGANPRYAAVGAEVADSGGLVREAEFSNALTRLSLFFAGANWRSAKVTTPVKQALEMARQRIGYPSGPPCSELVLKWSPAVTPFIPPTAMANSPTRRGGDVAD
jgi:uncharacterized protein YjbI with pentapeptide repeats